VSAAFAIETSSPRLQKMIHKNLKIEKTSLVIDAAVKAGIYSLGFFMLGFPTETYEEASDTIDFAVKSTLHRAIFSYPMPLAGTELAEMAGDVFKNRPFEPEKNNYNFSILNISAMSDSELHSVFLHAYKRFYLSPRRILKMFIHHPRILSLPRSAFTLTRVLWEERCASIH
jgi:anaerobic magnesium-protoporphyrin IX monomethyl ester cyclase